MTVIERKPVMRARLTHACCFCQQHVAVGGSYVRYRFVDEDGEPGVAKLHPECDRAAGAPEYEEGWDARAPQPRPAERIALVSGRSGFSSKQRIALHEAWTRFKDEERRTATLELIRKQEEEG